MRIGALLNHEVSPHIQWIELASTLQIPSFHVIGLPGPEVNEARERVRAAIEASGFEFPRRRVILNLAPASIRKRGTGLDLPMALAVLRSGLADPETDDSLLAWGELGLDGRIKPAGQVLRTLHAAWNAGVARVLFPPEEAGAARRALRLLAEAEAFAGPPPRLLIAGDLRVAWEAAQGRVPADTEVETSPPVPVQAPPGLMPLAPALERAIAVSAVGAHHLLLLGPRGTGKSHALDWLAWLQPRPTSTERLSHALLAELRQTSPIPSDPGAPVRRISSQVRPGALLGSVDAESVRPGEFSLADGGLILADEFPEWPRDSREIFREPLERGVISLTRAHSCGTVELPARFTLAANGNLCACGGWPPELPVPRHILEEGGRVPRCRCSAGTRVQYLGKLSGPILDRMDVVLFVLSPRGRVRSQPERPARAQELADRVTTLRAALRKDLGAPPGQLPPSRIDGMLRERPAWSEALDQLARGSLRARHKIVRVALTLAAWDGAEEPTFGHIAEASSFRPEALGLGGG